MVYILLVIGFVCLVKGADFFVSGSSAIARHFNIPAFIIGLTIVAFGTSMPEAAVSVTAAMKGANGIAVGNVLGSNMFNLLVVLGFSALIKACPVSKAMMKFEYPLSVIAAAVIMLMCIGKGQHALVLSRPDGIILLAIFTFFIVFTIKKVMSSKEETVLAAEDTPDEDEAEGAVSLPKSIVLSITGVAGIIVGGDLVVDCASDIAASFGIDDVLIGLTVVALGTSLPELVTSIVAAVKGETDIAVGNVVSSNLFNLLFVLGLSVTIHPIEVTMASIYDSAILIIVSIIAAVPMIRRQSLSRAWGILMLLMYGAYLTYIIMRAF